jgi:type IV pilus assembly protein PilB
VGHGPRDGADRQSGKTNTLYSAISRINTPETNIMTAEDPVEFNLPGVNQVQMKDSIGLNFAAALRSFLRQDPNIILVGEIRDFETAEIAVKAALTGHLVLSTLHTNDAPSTINRLMNMGIEPYLVATSVVLIAAQRLIRRVCASCKAADRGRPAGPRLARVHARGREDRAGHEGQGLREVQQHRLQGPRRARRGPRDLEEIRELILSGASSIEIKRKGLEEGMISSAARACRRSRTA